MTNEGHVESLEETQGVYKYQSEEMEERGKLGDLGADVKCVKIDGVACRDVLNTVKRFPVPRKSRSSLAK